MDDDEDDNFRTPRSLSPVFDGGRPSTSRAHLDSEARLMQKHPSFDHVASLAEAVADRHDHVWDLALAIHLEVCRGQNLPASVDKIRPKQRWTTEILLNYVDAMLTSVAKVKPSFDWTVMIRQLQMRDFSDTESEGGDQESVIAANAEIESGAAAVVDAPDGVANRVQPPVMVVEPTIPDTPEPVVDPAHDIWNQPPVMRQPPLVRHPRQELSANVGERVQNENYPRIILMPRPRAGEARPLRQRNEFARASSARAQSDIAPSVDQARANDSFSVATEPVPNLQSIADSDQMSSVSRSGSQSETETATSVGRSRRRNQPARTHLDAILEQNQAMMAMLMNNSQSNAFSTERCLMLQGDVTFDGTDSAKFEVWAETVEGKARAGHLPDQDKLLLMKRTLRGEALKSFLRRDFKDFNTAMRFMRRRYEDYIQKEIDQDEFEVAVWDRKMPAIDYFKYLCDVCQYPVGSRERKVRICANLVQNLKDKDRELAVKCRAYDTLDLNWLESKYEERERVRRFANLPCNKPRTDGKADKKADRSSADAGDDDKRYFCTICNKKTGHTAADCTRPTSSGSQTPQKSDKVRATQDGEATKTKRRHRKKSDKSESETVVYSDDVVQAIQPTTAEQVQRAASVLAAAQSQLNAAVAALQQQSGQQQLQSMPQTPASAPSQSTRNREGGGAGRGAPAQGRGRSSVDVAKVRCYHCQQLGHFRNRCPQLQSEAGSSEQPDQVRMVRGYDKPKDDERQVSVAYLDGENWERESDGSIDLWVSKVGVPKVRRLFDTGSTPNLVLASWMKQNHLRFRPTLRKLRAVNDTHIDLIGVVQLPVATAKANTTARFYVVENLCHDVPIGTDTMDELGLTLTDATGRNYMECGGVKSVTLVARIREVYDTTEEDEEMVFIWPGHTHPNLTCASVALTKEFRDRREQLEKQEREKRYVRSVTRCQRRSKLDAEAKVKADHISAVNIDETAPGDVTKSQAVEEDCADDDESDSDGEEVDDGEPYLAQFDGIELHPGADHGPELCDTWEEATDAVDWRAQQGVDDKAKFVDELDFGEGLTADQKHLIVETLWSVRSAFSSAYVASTTQNVNDIGVTNVVHDINTVGAPFKVKARRIPLAQVHDVETMVNELLEGGYIQKSKSPYSSCIVLVRKKDGSWRMCVDYRMLNSQTVPDQTPLPRIDSLLDRAAGHEWLTALDIKAAYYNIRVRENDVEKTAFSVGDRLYEFTRMPFGLCTAAQTFQRAITEALRGVADDNCLAYLDDVVIFSDTFEEHMEHVSAVCSALCKFGLKLNSSKSSFARRSLRYLGHWISRDGIKADEGKVQSIIEYPRPQTKRMMRRYLGLCKYLGRYYRHLAELLKPLNMMTTEGKRLQGPLKWTEETIALFEFLRSALASPPVLKPPIVGRTYFVVTDASKYGYGGVMMQEHGGELCPVYYASKAATSAEQRYAPVEQEARAVIYCLEKWRPYLLLEDVQVLTDHRPLVSMFLKKNTDKITPRLYRWLLTAQQYRLTIRYLPGIHNEGADALSRIFEPPDGQQWKQVCAVRVDEGDVNQAESRRDIVRRFHAGKSGGHFGWRKVLKRLQSFYSLDDWPTMSADVKDVCQRCNICRQRSCRYETVPLQPMPPPFRPGHTWHLDFSEFRSGAQYHAAAVAVDAFSRWIIVLPTKKQDAEAALKLMELVYSHSGRPVKIVTDSGTHFVCKSFQLKLDEWNVSHLVCTPYQKTANGMAERAIQTVQEVVSRHCKQNGVNPDRWHTICDEALVAYNTSPHSSLGSRSPFEVERGVAFALSGDEIANKSELELFWQTVRKDLLKAQDFYADKHRHSRTAKFKFTEGQPVWVQHTAGMRQRKRKIDLPNQLAGTILHFKHRSAVVEMGDGKTRAVPLSMLQPRYPETQ